VSADINQINKVRKQQFTVVLIDYKVS